jgi:predicted molibdopterin-dependent oxidoreductase YjgC
MITLTIDGKKVEVPEGTTVLRAAEKAGVHIPTLCDQKHLSPYGGCRLCLVEVEGARTLQPSCTLPAANAMVVYTNTPQVQEARTFVLTLLFSERNHFCMYCPVSGGDCELQNSAYGQGMTEWPLQPNWEPYPVDGSHEFFVMDHNRCILCRRCVRACGELVGNFTLGTQERGASSRIIADLDTPLGESTCVSCGTCLQVCPTGALIDRKSAYQGRLKDVQHVKSTCVGCSVGCGIEMIVRDNRLLRIEGDWDAPVNQGVLCKIGRFEPLTDQGQRIVTPLVRKNGSLKAATWDEALGVIVSKLKSLQAHNGDGLAALASTRLPAEALYLFKQLFADRLGSNMVTSIEEGVTTALPGWLARKAGKSLEGTLEEVKKADLVVAVGVDLVDNHQVAGFFVKRSLPLGTKLIVIDPYDNGMHDLADYSLRPKKDSDYDLLVGLMQVIASLGMTRQPTAETYDLTRHTPDNVSRSTGIPAETIREVARLIGSAQRPVFIYGKGLTRAGFPKALEAFLDLARMASALTEERKAVIGTKGQANSLAAYLLELDKPFETKGRQAVYLALGDDKASPRLVERLEGVPFLVVQASYASSVTEKADVVLPAAIWAEQEGHFVNLEGRLQEAQKGVNAPRDAKDSTDVFQALASGLGVKLDKKWREALKSRVPINPISC